MRVLVQRSKESFVKVNNNIVGKIDKGLVLLVGFTYNDDEAKIRKMIKKILNLRIFDDEAGVMNKNILDKGGSILSISQFTLYANTKNGNRPSYVDALKYDDAKILYEKFNMILKESIMVSEGVFGADMEVHIINDGPITIIIDSKNK